MGITLARACALAALAALACAHGPKENVLGAQRELATRLVRQREWGAAFSVADAMCRSAPGEADGFLLRGVVFREQRLYPEAQADLEEAVRLAPDSAPAHAALAVLHELMGRPEEALASHRRATELAPRSPEHLNNLGFSLFVHGRPREAIPVLREALRSAPADRRIRNNLGFAFAAAGDFTHAAEQFELGGTPAEARTNLGWAYERRGSLAQAFDLYLEALRLDPGSKLARRNLDRVARDLGREVPAAAPPEA